MPGDVQCSAAVILVDSVVADVKAKRSLPFGAQVQPLQRKSLNEALRLAIRRKPCCPNLNRQPDRISLAPVSPRIHQQITKPPRAAAIRQAHAKKPYFVAAAQRQRGEDFIQCRQGFSLRENTRLSHRPLTLRDGGHCASPLGGP